MARANMNFRIELGAAVVRLGEVTGTLDVRGRTAATVVGKWDGSACESSSGNGGGGRRRVGFVHRNSAWPPREVVRIGQMERRAATRRRAVRDNGSSGAGLVVTERREEGEEGARIEAAFVIGGDGARATKGDGRTGKGNAVEERRLTVAVSRRGAANKDGDREVPCLAGRRRAHRHVDRDEAKVRRLERRRVVCERPQVALAGALP